VSRLFDEISHPHWPLNIRRIRPPLNWQSDLNLQFPATSTAEPRTNHQQQTQVCAPRQSMPLSTIYAMRLIPNFDIRSERQGFLCYPFHRAFLAWLALLGFPFIFPFHMLALQPALALPLRSPVALKYLCLPPVDIWSRYWRSLAPATQRRLSAWGLSIQMGQTLPTPKALPYLWLPPLNQPRLQFGDWDGKWAITTGHRYSSTHKAHATTVNQEFDVDGADARCRRCARNRSGRLDNWSSAATHPTTFEKEDQNWLH